MQCSAHYTWYTITYCSLQLTHGDRECNVQSYPIFATCNIDRIIPVLLSIHVQDTIVCSKIHNLIFHCTCPTNFLRLPHSRPLAVFGYFSDVLGQVFFPPQEGHKAIMESFVVFGLAFLCRPIGGVIMGYIGESLCLG